MSIVFRQEEEWTERREIRKVKLMVERKDMWYVYMHVYVIFECKIVLYIFVHFSWTTAQVFNVCVCVWWGWGVCLSSCQIYKYVNNVRASAGSIKATNLRYSITPVTFSFQYTHAGTHTCTCMHAQNPTMLLDLSYNTTPTRFTYKWCAARELRWSTITNKNPEL